MKSDADRGPIGAWARRARLDAGYGSAQEAVAAMAQVGLSVDLGYLRGIESGAHRPGKGLQAQLAAFYRAAPPVEEETITLTRTDLQELMVQAGEIAARRVLAERGKDPA